MPEGVRLIDISPHQHPRGSRGPDWQAIRASGVSGVYLRAREGKDADEVPGGYSFEQHRRAALEAGLLVGAYQYLRARHPGRYQADLLLEQLGDLGPGELPPAVDCEELHGRSAVETQACLLAWVDRVHLAIGRDPVVYTGPAFWTATLHGQTLSELAGCPLWLAAYLSTKPAAPRPWGRVALWQYTGSGSVPGVAGSCDVSLWQGDEASLRAWAGGVCRGPF